MRYFENVTLNAIYEALDRSCELIDAGRSIIKETNCAGQPQTHYIFYNGKYHPLKAIIKNAMMRCNLDPCDAFLREFTSHNGRDWLKTFKDARFDLVEGDISLFEMEREEQRTKKLYEAFARPNQASFRSSVIRLYSGICPITKNSTLSALEAAHIVPFATGGNDAPSNGLLLRADLHRLFDLNLFAINPRTLQISFSNEIVGDYRKFDGFAVELPKHGPAADEFEQRWKLFKK